MLFQSYIFVFAFLPAGLLCWHLLKRFGHNRIAVFVLCLLSLAFYAYGDPGRLLILLSAAAGDYFLAFLIQKRRDGSHLRRALYIGTLLGNLAVFVIYRGTLGVSFFMFSLIAFVTDIYLGREKLPDFLLYLGFVTFFPKLASGPIVYSNELVPQFGAQNYVFDRELFARGACLFILGLSKKVLLADQLGLAVDWGYDHIMSLDTPAALITVIGYVLQLLLDFTGYCDMGLGVAMLFGIRMPDNFDAPYRSTSMKMMWRTWHMTLGRFFTKYVYIPLGGNRKGIARTLVNVMIVFLLSGYWHGSTWGFIIWGALQGIAVCFDDLMELKGGRRLPGWFGNLLTSVYWTFSFIFFRAGSVSDAFLIMKRIFSGSFQHYTRNVLAMKLHFPEGFLGLKVLLKFTEMNTNYVYVALLLFILAVAFLLSRLPSAARRIEKRRLTGGYAFLMAVLFIWSVISFGSVTTFIYFRF